ncbi:hypothetical protein BB561_001421 [Smittium simulii]|uniref:Uncharacterized protein n=1 Tax=Smittium simulii TaxID=133385 RepID=A0A2T9YUQ1_9FUNG|nr:hypothetical protein BB561_001421 [Smittium simulii]
MDPHKKANPDLFSEPQDFNPADQGNVSKLMEIDQALGFELDSQEASGSLAVTAEDFNNNDIFPIIQETEIDMMSLVEPSPENGSSQSNSNNVDQNMPVQVKSENASNSALFSEALQSNNNEQANSNQETPTIKEEPVEDSEDPIVAKYPVYLSNKMAKYLRLFQYPLKNSDWHIQKEQTPSSVKIKPNSDIIELETPIETTHAMYSKQKGSSLAAGMAQGIGQSSNRIFDTQTWTSFPVKQKVKYAIGIFSNDASKKELPEEDVPPEPNAKSKTVQIKVRSLQAEEALKKQENSITKIRQKIEEEPWTQLEYFDFESEESNAVFTQLFATQKDKLGLNTSKSDYLNLMSPLNNAQKP